MGTKTNAHLIIPNAHRVIPKATAPGRRIGNLVHVVHQDVDLADFSFDPCEQRCDLRVISMIDLNGDTFSACFVDHLDGGVNRERSIAGRTTSDVHRCAFFSESDCGAASNTPTRTSDNRNLANKIATHAVTPLAAVNSMSRSVKPRSMKLGKYWYLFDSDNVMVSMRFDNSSAATLPSRRERFAPKQK